MDFVANPFSKELDRLNKQTDDLYHAIALKAGISDTAFMVLYYIRELGDGCLQKDICNRCFLSKQTIHSAVRKLEKSELLRSHAGKGRDRHLFLTENGEAFVREKVVPVFWAENRAFAVLTPQEQKELVRLNQKYLDQLRIQTQRLI